MSLPVSVFFLNDDYYIMCLLDKLPSGNSWKPPAHWMLFHLLSWIYTLSRYIKFANKSPFSYRVCCQGNTWHGMSVNNLCHTEEIKYFQHTVCERGSKFRFNMISFSAISWLIITVVLQRDSIQYPQTKTELDSPSNDLGWISSGKVIAM